MDFSRFYSYRASEGQQYQSPKLFPMQARNNNKPWRCAAVLYTFQIVCLLLRHTKFNTTIAKARAFMPRGLLPREVVVGADASDIMENVFAELCKMDSLKGYEGFIARIRTREYDGNYGSSNTSAAGLPRTLLRDRQDVHKRVKGFSVGRRLRPTTHVSRNTLRPFCGDMRATKTQPHAKETPICWCERMGQFPC